MKEYDDAIHAKHVKYFNEHYIKNVKHRVEEDGEIHFTYPFPVTRLIDSYNDQYEDAHLDIRLEFAYRDEEGRDYGYFVVC